MLNGVCAVCVACQTDRGAQRETGTPLAKMLTGRMPKPGEERGGAGVGGRDGRVLQQLLCIRTGAYIRVHKQRRLKTATTIIKLNCCLM